MRALRKAGTPSHPEQVARALLDAARSDKIYVPDPVDAELIVSPECLFGTCGGLEFDGGDCDDLSAGLASALLSVGVVCAIVGQYDTDHFLRHVLVGVWDGTRWWYADPSNPRYELGVADPATEELWLDVMTGRTLCHGQCEQSEIKQPPAPTATRGSADFVGVGSDQDPPRCESVEPEGFGVWSFIAGLAIGVSVTAVALLVVRR